MTRQVVEIGPWRVEVDATATRSVYRQITEGAEACTCDHCQSFANHRDEIYSPPVRELLARLGIDYRREDEVWYASLPDDHDCVGGHQFVGRMLDGPSVPDQGEMKFVPVDEGFAVLVRPQTRTPLRKPMAKAFDDGQDLVELSFLTTRHNFDPAVR